MRQAIRTKATRHSRINRSLSYPAPVGGWNERDSLASMKPNQAIVLKNFFPKTGYCEVRGGYSSHATGMTGNGKTLAVYNAPSGTNKMYCYTASGVYDVSSSGAVGASKLARTNGKHQWTMFGDGTNNWLIAVNGVDKPAYYDGSTWTAVDNVSSPALTGLTTTNIIGVFEFKGRLIFIEKSSLSFWYLASGAAGGALTEFDLSGVAKKGGYLMAGITWTFDGGSGPDDRAVFITSEGEVLVYQGTNPSSAASWALTGVFDLGKPLGRRCLQKYAGDVIAVTESGALPLSRALQSTTVNNEAALTNIIDNAFNESARSYGSTFGWEAIVYPAQAALIVNIPIAEDGVHEQYVMNTITKAWCKFTDWDAETFAVYNGQLYFADGTATYKAWSGTADDGSNITAYGKTAFSYFSDMGTQKRFSMFRPLLASNGSISFLADIDVDFNDTEITGTATYTAISGGQWDVGNWDEAYWAGGVQVLKEWTSPDENIGYCASGKIKIVTNTLTVQWIANDYVFETGSPL